MWTLKKKQENLSEDNLEIKLAHLVIPEIAHKFCHSPTNTSNPN